MTKPKFLSDMLLVNSKVNIEIVEQVEVLEKALKNAGLPVEIPRYRLDIPFERKELGQTIPPGTLSTAVTKKKRN